MPDPSIVNIEVSNPFFEGRNRVYLIRSEPLTLIDTGVATERGFQRLVEGLDQHGYAPSDIERVVLTHKHIDHIGNAWRIQQLTGAEILIHESEVRFINEADANGSRYQQLVQERLASWQVPEQEFPSQKKPFNLRWEIESASASPLVDGQIIPLADGPLEVIHTPGHTYGSICLKLGKQLFTGDHVLPDTSPNIGGGDMRRTGLLSQFMQSLERIADVAPQIDCALPGHGAPFEQLAKRCHALSAHHVQRLEDVRTALEQAGPSTVFEIARMIFGKLREFHIILGCAETQSHLELLVDQGRVTCDQGRYAASDPSP